ncbi:FitA-like ribbon-helix-helix domain-containing protein [Agromyces neolithicus]|uniref:Antitoxin FitA-like ribbon-helix-helix domain-containing protein n=1 Tax=Agromyces neolithicus TaxID=269420 RepID=A0ABN2M1A4_9MICO
MPNVLIRDLSPDVHAVLVARAEREGQSLQQYLSLELAKLAGRPTVTELLAEIDARPDGLDLTSQEIERAIRAGRERRQ